MVALYRILIVCTIFGLLVTELDLAVGTLGWQHIMVFLHVCATKSVIPLSRPELSKAAKYIMMAYAVVEAKFPGGTTYWRNRRLGL